MVIRTEDSQPQGPKDPRKRKLPVRAVALLLVAVGAALGAAVLLTRFMDARVSAARVPTTKIIVARVDIPVARPIEPDWLAAVDWPSAARPEGAVSDPASIVGRVAFVPISRGEAVLPAKLVVAGTSSGLATLIPEGMRAVAVKVNEVVGVAGFIHPGDRVDVIVTMQPVNNAPYVSKIVLQDIRVLAVGQELEHRGKDSKEAKPVTVATLMVTSEESERLALSADRGHILLALRGLGDEEYAETKGITPPALLTPSTPEAPKKPPAVASRPRPRPREIAQPVPAATAEKHQIEILRGDLFEKRTFEKREARP